MTPSCSVASISVVSGPMRAAAADLGRAAQERARLDDGVLADRDGHVDQRRGGIDDRDAGDAVRVMDAPLGDRADLRELDAVVDAERDVGIVEHVRV